ncbi:hypothetical protein [Rhizobium mayense]|uniref:Uncharacterized protein n=1 Tax=Rhizobium mayense TaxID=1312184 RepID=A0ABT7K727_9HYPH|nr:hypothetical protein [Rhizobium mayense]MDL2402949.1 hypothetical protein [Rhizobium mayense]
MPSRTVGYDAIRRTADGSKQHIQIKGRAFGNHAKQASRRLR